MRLARQEVKSGGDLEQRGDECGLQLPVAPTW
jgi:hypothetical protein